jgi:hypothetical protein
VDCRVTPGNDGKGRRPQSDPIIPTAYPPVVILGLDPRIHETAAILDSRLRGSDEMEKFGLIFSVSLCLCGWFVPAPGRQTQRQANPLKT